MLVVGTPAGQYPQPFVSISTTQAIPRLARSRRIVDTMKYVRVSLQNGRPTSRR